MSEPLKIEARAMWAFTGPSGQLEVCSSPKVRVRYPKGKWRVVKTSPVIVLVLGPKQP
jgi:hypothetical protein